MDTKEKRLVVDRLCQWGEWKDKSITALGYPKTSPVERLRLLGVRVDQAHQNICPEYNYEEYNARTDRIINTMSERYKCIAVFEFCGKNGTHAEKKEDLKKIARKYNLIKYKNGRETIQDRKVYILKNEMLFYMYTALRLGACTKVI